MSETTGGDSSRTSAEAWWTSMSCRKENGGGAMSRWTFSRMRSAFSGGSEARSISFAFSMPPTAIRSFVSRM